MKEDFVQEIDQRRAVLYPVFKAAKEKNLKPKLVVDRLLISGKRYSVDNLDTLPEELQLNKLAERRTDTAVRFYGGESCFSNFFKANMLIDGKLYTSVEQFFQYQKATCLENPEVANKIISNDDPKVQHRLGKSLQGQHWDQHKAKLTMETAIRAKFQQNDFLKTKLLNTNDKLLIECNPYDKYWSCGLKISNDEADNANHWKGKNVMGTILCNVRGSLK